MKNDRRATAGRLTNYLWLITIISMIVFLFGILYYFETEKKERYFDQLYFRQLEEISRGFETNLVRLQSFTGATRSFISATWRKHAEPLEKSISNAQPGGSGKSERPVENEIVSEGEQNIEDTSAVSEFLIWQEELKGYEGDADDNEATKVEIAGYFVDLIKEEHSEADAVNTQELEEMLKCVTGVKKVDYIDYVIWRSYCGMLNGGLSIINKLPEYIKLEVKEVNDGTISSVKTMIDDLINIRSSIDGLKNTRSSVTTYSRVDYQQEIDNKRRVVQLIKDLRSEEFDDARTADSSFKEFRDRFNRLEKYFQNDDLKIFLVELYGKEKCDQLCISEYKKNISEKLYVDEIALQNKQIQQSNDEEVNLLLLQFTLEITDTVDILIDDLNRFYAAAEKVLSEARMQTDDKTVAEILKEKESYLAEDGPVEVSARRHGLGLRYHKGECVAEALYDVSDKDCSDGLFIRKSEKSSPYTVSNRIVTSYLPEGNAVTAPMENLLPMEMGQFSTVLITSEKGEVIIQTDSLNDLGSQHFLGIKDLLAKANKSVDENSDNAIVDKEGKKNDDHELKHSAFVDEKIGGIAYRLYIRPHTVGQVSLYFNDKSEPQSTLYFVGIKPLSELRASKLNIPPGTSMALFSIVIAILLALIFLKIGLAHMDASFTSNEGLLAVLAVILFVTVSTIVITTLGVWDKLNREIEADAYESIDLIQKRFNDEIQTYLEYLDNLLAKKEIIRELTGEKKRFDNTKQEMQQVNKKDANLLLSSEKSIAEFNEGLRYYKSVYGNVPYLRSNKPVSTKVSEEVNVSPLENLFMLNEKGRVTGGLIRGTKNLVSSPPKDLSARKYFRNALEGRVWELELKCADRPQLKACATGRDGAIFPVNIERIFNILDGDLNTQFALPVKYQVGREKLYDNAYTFDASELYGYQSESPKVISYGVTLHTFKAPILPSGLQFAVIDNNTGMVLYHSNDNRSLVENFLQETENNPELKALISVSQGVINGVGIRNVEFELFRGVYRGENTVFFAKDLHKDIPWTIVVFKASEEETLFIMLLFSATIIIALVTIVFTGFILFVSMIKNDRLMDWLWPQMYHVELYNKCSIAIICSVLPMYLLLSYLDSTLLLILLTATAVLILVFAMQRYFGRFSPEDKYKVPDLKQFRHRYLVFMISVLLFAVAVPSLVISEKVGADLLHRVSINKTIKLYEARNAAQNKIDARIARLCGKMANERNDYSDCKSIDALLMTQLNKYIHTLVYDDVDVCAGLDRPIFCLTDDQSPSDGDLSETGVSLLLESYKSIWAKAVLLGVLGEADDDAFELNVDEKYYLNHKYPNLIYLIYHMPWILLLVALSWFIALILIDFLMIRLLGINVPRSYRAGYCELDWKRWDGFIAGDLGSQIASKFDHKQLLAVVKEGASIYSILIRPRADTLSALLKNLDNQISVDGISHLPIDVLKLASSPCLRKQVKDKINSMEGSGGILVLDDIESIAFNKSKRTKVLEFLETLIKAEGGVSILILCDVAPLYMLTHQSQYIPDTMSDEFADAQEVVRWSRLLSKFSKQYDWSPMDLEFKDLDAKKNIVLRELSAWPELYPLKASVEELMEQGKSMECVIQYISTHAGPIYRHRWSFCTKEEKLLLYQLAKGMMINPQNIEPLEHLMRRGFIRRDPNWSIVNYSFARFVLTAEAESVYSKWVTASEQGLWKVLRVPLFTAALVILGILMYSAQEATESFLALATSVLAMLPLLLRNLSLVRSAPNSTPDN